MNIQFTPDTVAVVTGASKGIGLACAKVLDACGARVVMVSRDARRLESARAELDAGRGRAIAMDADLSDGAAAENLVERIEREIGPISVLVNSAGAARRFAVDELGPEAFAQGISAKYLPGVHMMTPVARLMAGRGAGSIVNIIGQGGKQAGVLHIAGGAANAALMLATVGFARAYADKGIRINAINPGLTRTTRVTEGLEAASRATGQPIDRLLAEAEAAIPMGRMAEPEEIANLTAFLASDLAAYVSGAIVPMDGCSASVI
jgi:NAD(P)-dependent dehydrogenase (short-subunit alcohol dehydrogenase family)